MGNGKGILPCAALGVISAPAKGRKVGAEAAFFILCTHKARFGVKKIFVIQSPFSILRLDIGFAENFCNLRNAPITVCGVKRQINALFFFFVGNIAELAVAFRSVSAEILFAGILYGMMNHSLKSGFKQILFYKAFNRPVADYRVNQRARHTAAFAD